ncbi:Uncharacterised protein [Vibrio cholerae]|nr:Uncharacterised protein [Vibrio cholerae]CSC15538.1 Uncharacterised protein [Vibrio cholerae]CSC68436.1 Uncharacterised protein [Vibrio cholerae]CSI48158.1 Uncharacterised protein [Vibrio cholerae]
MPNGQNVQRKTSLVVDEIERHRAIDQCRKQQHPTGDIFSPFDVFPMVKRDIDA